MVAGLSHRHLKDSLPKMNKILLSIIPAMLSLFVSCSEPVSGSQFVKTGSRDAYGRYEFNVDMQDSLASYDVSLVASFACADRKFVSFKSLPISLLWESPDGVSYEGAMSLARSSMNDSSYYAKTFREEVGERLVPVRYGKWKLFVKAPEDSLKKYGLSGVGIIVRKDNSSR